ncbi:MltR family transcriptional regulator [Nitrosospira briensis]|uniref:MltR family transcriptional regulator n=1 Tax=Nitrosospira briensis TaxID=35799 RepID=UPI0008E1ED2B|nr:MltR family transcriptional regulator [Nitrosospira briensis]SFN67319.1 Mannitol repressor [Nitrosospira briensis]
MARRLPATDEELRKRLLVFLETIDKESDRGCVLVSAAIIDECLEILLRSQLSQKEPKVLNSLFSGQGPLSSFWSKIQFARAMELIPGWIYDDLERIRGLRNIFAHRYDSADFDDADVMLFTTKLEGANYAVVAIEKKENAIQLPTYNDQELTEGCLGERTRKVLKKERLRFILTSSYIGGWLESEVKIRALKKEILESKIRIEALKKETEGLKIEKQDLENEVSEGFR